MEALCKDCIWYMDSSQHDLAPTCTATQLGTSLIDGKQLAMRAAHCRDQEIYCGPRGMWYLPERRGERRQISVESYEFLRRR